MVGIELGQEKLIFDFKLKNFVVSVETRIGLNYHIRHLKKFKFSF